ncbi:hypothetical protein BDZ97DRAFT_1596123, partial [Flammula alnicola]
YAPQSWIDRADDMELGYLMANTPPSPLICLSRGKLLLLAAGPHALVICLALETGVIGMPLDLYQEIITKDCPGPNEDVDKANELRIFHLPENLTVDHSSPTYPRTIKIVSAFVSDKWAWVINDFTSLVRMYVTSSDVFWSYENLLPTSDNWIQLFDKFRGGPDWILERALAEHNLDFNSATTASISEPNNHFYPILEEIMQNRLGAFSGIGRYSANDLLYHLCLFPGMPSHVLCSNDSMFKDFKAGIFNYLRQFTERTYLTR